MTNETIRPAAPFTADSLSRAVDEAARQLVNREVHYCVSSLISTLTKAAYLDGEAAALIRSDIADGDKFAGLVLRSPDADDYREALAYSAEKDRVQVTGAGDDWQWRIVDPADGEELDGADEDAELTAYQQAFAAAGIDEPDASEVYEHWLVSDWFAEMLEARGETVVRDVAGMTVWGRCTTGQAIYADHVVQEIARDLHDLPRTAD